MKKYKFTDNLGLKIIAVIFAAFLWLIVVNLDNPVSTQTFSEVPVTIINEDIILSAGDTYQVLGEEKVSVVVSATRQVRQKLTKEDIVATADIKEMDTSTGLVRSRFPYRIMPENMNLRRRRREIFRYREKNRERKSFPLR